MHTRPPLMDLLKEVESRFDVNQWKIDGICVWPLIRMDLMGSFYFNDTKGGKKNLTLLFKIREGLKIMFGALKYLRAYVRDHSHNARLAPADVVFLADGISRVQLRGSAYDRFCDPLIAILNRDHLTSLTLEPLHHYITPRFSSSLFIQPRLDWLLLKRMLFAKRKHVVHLPEYETFIAFLKSKELGIPLPDTKRITTIFSAVSAYSEVFEKILRQVKPRFGFVVSYYGPIGLAFTLACHKLRIPSADIQHGSQGEVHPAYAGWSKVPPQGYEVVPTVFLCWSKDEVAVSEKWHRAVEIGNPFLALWLDDTNETVRYYDEIITHSLKKDNEAKHVLITLSYNKDDEESLRSTIAAMQLASPEWHWWIRLHPASLHRRKAIERMFTEHGIKHFEIDLPSTLPLYALLQHTDAHVTHSSSTVIEALSFGVCSVVTGEPKFFPEQIASGQAVYADTPETIYRALGVQLDKKNNSRQPRKNVAPEPLKVLKQILHETSKEL